MAVFRTRPTLHWEILLHLTEFPLPVRVMLQAWKMPVKQFAENSQTEVVRKGLTDLEDRSAALERFRHLYMSDGG